MLLRRGLVSFLVVSATFAADQPPIPAKPDPATQSPTVAQPDDSNAPPKAATQSWRSHIHFGGLAVGAGFSHYSGGYPSGYGPRYWSYSPYYQFDPVLWSPYYHPGYYTGFARQPDMGNVRIAAPDKTSLVFLDGALAGRLDKLKDMWLEPGAYNLEVRSSSHRLTQKIYVLSGKTLKVTPDMMVNEVLQ